MEVPALSPSSGSHENFELEGVLELKQTAV